VINGVPPLSAQAQADYADFSPHGITAQSDGSNPSVELRAGTLPVLHEAADVVNVDVPTAAKNMCAFSRKDGEPHFRMFRTILTSASFMRDAARAAEALCDLRILSPEEIGALTRIYLGGDNDYIASYLDDTVPRVLPSGASFNVSFIIRNDGWNDLTSACVLLQVNIGGARTTLSLPSQSVSSGQVFTVAGHVTIPSGPGHSELEYGLVVASGCAAPGTKFKTLPYTVAVTIH
jgi:hypothetical protein